MKKADVIESVREVAHRVTEGRGFELVDVEVKQDRGGRFVRLYVDKEGGIGLDELQSVSEEVSAILDAEDPIESSYTLEVSSPGLDRPLKTEADYRRNVGRLVKISSYEPVDGRRHWTGRLLALDDGDGDGDGDGGRPAPGEGVGPVPTSSEAGLLLRLRLDKEKGLEVRVPLDKVAHGRLEVEFR